MIVCFFINPTKLEVVFLCSFGNRLDKKIYEILDTAFAAYNKLQRARKQKKVDWLFPTIFGDSKPVQKNEVKNVQERYANMILEHIEASTYNDMN
ncbi:hypothetical protein QL285_047545 [Trifolium repens]|nr:hypothetical protein QL285_047545 [Trifolium repens]